MTLSDAGFMALVERKRSGGEHSRDEIDALVAAYAAGAIDDDRFALWLHAVVANGLSDDETAWLTHAMAVSGTVLSWDDVAGVVDKHSTGGVGDAVSLISVPLAAACGVKVAKLSGRALGHTGGTIDKLETIPGVRTDLSVDAFKRQVVEVGCAIAQATNEIAPADKKIYALRHRTNTVENVGLITASVLSKKIAGGAPHLVIDVKCGRSAFMQTRAQAHALARTITQVGQRLGRSVTVLITDMDEPLATSIGDVLEMDEAIAVLRGRTGGRLREAAIAIAEAMLAVHQSDERKGESARRAALERALRDGSAFQQFVAMAQAQGGDVKSFETPATPGLTVVAQEPGFIASIDGRAIAEAVALANSRAPERTNVGVRLRKRRGDSIGRGEVLADVFAGDQAARLAPAVRDSVTIASQAPQALGPVVVERMHAGVERS